MKITMALREAGRPMSDVMEILRTQLPDLETLASKALRNLPCPCGSGLKTKHCHGGSNAIDPSKPTVYPVFVAEPRRRVTGLPIEI